jgi:hypothetical protein
MLIFFYRNHQDDNECIIRAITADAWPSVPVCQFLPESKASFYTNTTFQESQPEQRAVPRA